MIYSGLRNWNHK